MGFKLVILIHRCINTFLVIWPTVTGPLLIRELQESLEKVDFSTTKNTQKGRQIGRKHMMLTSFSLASIILDLIANILYHPR